MFVPADVTLGHFKLPGAIHGDRNSYWTLVAEEFVLCRYSLLDFPHPVLCVPNFFYPLYLFS